MVVGRLLFMSILISSTPILAQDYKVTSTMVAGELRAMEADTVAILVAPNYLAVRRNGGVIEDFNKQNEIDKILQVAITTKKHIVRLDATPTNTSYGEINRLLDAGLKAQGIRQKTDQYLQWEDSRKPQDKKEALYTCIAGFNFELQHGADHNFNHNYFSILQNDVLVVVNRKGTVEFRHLKSEFDHPFEIRPRDEYRKTNILDPRGSPQVSPVSKFEVLTDRMIIPESAAEIRIQSILQDKVAYRNEDLNSFKEELRRGLSATLEKGGVNPSLLKEAYSSDYNALNKSQEKLKACKSLKNGTIDAAVEKQLELIEQKRKELNAVYWPYIKKLNAEGTVAH